MIYLSKVVTLPKLLALDPCIQAVVHDFVNFSEVKFSFFEKATKIWSYLTLVLTFSKSADLSKQLEDNCEILWSSQKS